MKILKWIGIIIVTLFVLVTVIGLFQPEDLRVERTHVIGAPPAQVFAVLNNTKEFKKWSAWHKKDTNTVYVYSGPESGKGASFTWNSPTGKIGYGKWEILNAVPNERVDLQFEYEHYPATPAGYILTPVGKDSTQVTWFLEGGKATNPWERFGGIFMRHYVGTDYEEGLVSLDAYMKTKPAVAMAAMKPAGRVDKIGIEDFKGGHALTIRGTVSAADIGPVLGQRYAAMGSYMKANNLAMVGPPFAVYHTWNGTTTDMEACVWVDKANVGAGNVNGVEVPPGRVVVADYYGPYAGSEAAHFAIDEWAKANNVKLASSPWEEYLTDPMIEKDPMKVLTRIYYRVL